MLEFFPTNYVWNLSANIALLMGGNHGEIDTICRQLVEVSKAGDDAGMKKYIQEGLQKAEAEKSASGKTFGEMLKAGTLPEQVK